MHANIVSFCLDKITHTQLQELFSSSTLSNKGYGVDNSSIGYGVDNSSLRYGVDNSSLYNT